MREQNPSVYVRRTAWSVAIFIWSVTAGTALAQTQVIPPTVYESKSHYDSNGIVSPCFVGTAAEVTRKYIDFAQSITPGTTYELKDCATQPEWWSNLHEGEYCTHSTPFLQLQSCGYYDLNDPPRVATFNTSRGIECPAGYENVYDDANGFRILSCRIREDNTCPLENPVSPENGAKFHAETDYRLGSGDAVLELKRYYTSAGTQRSGASNNGEGYWRTSFDSELLAGVGPNSVFVLLRPDGKRRHFDSTGVELLNSDGAAARIAPTSGGWLLTLPNSDVEKYDSAGRLTSMTTRAGRVTQVVRNATGKIDQVIGPFGHTLSFGYNDAGQLATVTTPGGGTVAFDYSNGLLQKVTYPDSTSKTYRYEESNRAHLLTGIVDERGDRFATYGYDIKGRVTSEEHAGGANRYTFSYSASPRQTTVTDSYGAARVVGISTKAGVHNVTSVQGGPCATCGNAAQRTYTSTGNLASSLDFRGFLTKYEYNDRNLEIRRTEGLTSTGAFTSNTRIIITEWHPTYRIPTRTTEGGIDTSYTHDDKGNVLTKTVTDSTSLPLVARTWTYTYDSHGQLLTEDGPRIDVSDVTTYAYYDCSSGNACGQLETITDALGHVTRFLSYNADGRPLTVEDSSGQVTTLAYGLRQQITSVTAGSEVTTFDYWPTGLLRRLTLPDVSYLDYIYDAAHRLTEIRDSLGNRIVYTLDANGNRTSESLYDPSNALSRTHSRVFNSVNQLWKDLTAANTLEQTTIFGYDENGNLATINAPLSRNTTYQYDELNRVRQVADAAGGNTNFSYNSSDQVTDVTDPRGRLTRYRYNGFGDLTARISPDTGTTGLTYDSGGNVRLVTDQRGKVATYSYDALGRVTQTTYSDQTVSYGYDVGTNAVGQLTSVSNDSGRIDWQYTARGRISRKTQTIGTVAKEIVYGYNSAGQRTSLTMPSGRVVTYEYANNQITGIYVDSVLVLNQVLYEPFGPIRGWTWSNGSLAVRTYNNDGMPAQIDSAGLRTYGYDDAQRITAILDLDDSALSYAYNYDALDRLTNAATSNLTQAFTYDANGNRKTQSGSSTSTYTVASDSNRLLSSAGDLSKLYDYDESGNLISDGERHLLYNDAGRLVSATYAGQATTYQYNALGQRVKKANANGTTYFVFDESGHLIGEYDGSGALIQETVWLEDTPVATLRFGACGLAIFYIHSDHLNTPRKITKRSNSTVVWRWDGDPFGAAQANENPSGLGVFKYNLRFPGQYYDPETGLVHNGFRTYDPASGRYIQSDPVGLYGGLNTYAYVGGNPLSFSDPLGLYIPKDTANCKVSLFPAFERRYGERWQWFEEHMFQLVIPIVIGYGRDWEVGGYAQKNLYWQQYNLYGLWEHNQNYLYICTETDECGDTKTDVMSGNDQFKYEKLEDSGTRRWSDPWKYIPPFNHPPTKFPPPFPK